MNRVIPTLVCALLLATAGTASAQTELTERVERSLPATGITAVDLTNIRGAITITGGGTAVTIDALKRVPVRRTPAATRNLLRLVEVRVTALSGRVEVRTVFPRPRLFPGAVDYTVGVPEGTAVTLRTGGGDVRVSNVRGELRAVVVDGSLHVSAADAVVLLRCLSGTIDLTDASAGERALVQTVNGDVRMRKVTARSLDVSSVSGNLTMDDSTVTRLALRSTSGRVAYQGPLAPEGLYEFTSHAGNVDVAIAGRTGFELRASSFGGAARSAFKLDGARPGRPRDGAEPRALRGTVGDASARIVARSFSGDVTIRRKDN